MGRNTLSSEIQKKLSYLLTNNVSSKQITSQLGISHGTITTYRKILNIPYVAPKIQKSMINCACCNKLTTNPRFCSKTCSAKITNAECPKRLRKTKCIKCNNITKSYRTTLCEAHQKEYISRKRETIQERTLKEYWDLKSLQNLHVSSKNAHIRLLAREHFKELTKKPCANCGYDKHVELCHIKPVGEFVETDRICDVNSYNNLVQLCPNCHWEFDKGIIILENFRDVLPVGVEPTLIHYAPTD